MAGRPTDYSDGHYDLSEIVNSLEDDFENEKALCDYIELNIKVFCEECLGVKYKEHRREYPLKEGRRVKGNKRIDFMIVTEENQRIGVECKKPKYGCEVSAAIGQALMYLTLFEHMGRPLSIIVIVSTRIEWSLPFTIDKFNLPIKFIGFDKHKSLTYKNGSSIRK